MSRCVLSAMVAAREDLAAQIRAHLPSSYVPTVVAEDKLETEWGTQHEKMHALITPRLLIGCDIVKFWNSLPPDDRKKVFVVCTNDWEQQTARYLGGVRALYLADLPSALNVHAMHTSPDNI